MVAVGCADTVGGIGAHIVGGADLEVRHCGGEVALAAAVNAVGIVQRGVLQFAPAEAPADYGAVAAGGDAAAAQGRSGSDGRRREGCDHRQRGAYHIEGAYIVVLATVALRLQRNSGAHIERVREDLEADTAVQLFELQRKEEGAVARREGGLEDLAVLQQTHMQTIDGLLRGLLDNAPLHGALAVDAFLLEVADAGGKEQEPC